MFKIKWDKTSNGILLTDKLSQNEEILPPRPVFWEELDLLGFKDFWQYPKAEAPLLWAIDRRYYYKGEVLGEVTGGNIYQDHQILLSDFGKEIKYIEPIDVALLVDNNKDAIFILKNEAEDYVSDIYEKHKKKIGKFVVAFSGGKDSQVVLNIVNNCLHPEDFEVIFTDTTMEIPPTYSVVDFTRRLYEKERPKVKFTIVRHEKNAKDLWKVFGPPSRIHRWCCTVYKTFPMLRYLKDSSITQPKVLIFEGVRSEESARRGSYGRTANSTKHISQKNAEVIKDWNKTEVFLYLFSEKIMINKGYRVGLNRVGCMICPFSSRWSELILRKLYPELIDEFISAIKEYTSAIGVRDENFIEYLYEGQWKKRAGGKGIDTGGSRVEIISDSPNLEAILLKPKENLLEWLKTIGRLLYKTIDGKIVGEISTDGDYFEFEIDNNLTGKYYFTIRGLTRNIALLRKVKRLLYKSVYCIHCGACEAECPFGALIVSKSITINNKCKHCGNCINFTERGCLMAKSVGVSEGGTDKVNDNKMAGLSKYETFGMKQEWTSAFFTYLDNWFLNNNLGRDQVHSMIAWLRDAELIDKKQKKATNICRVLSNKYKEDELFVWQIIWINLFYNSSLIKWYVSNVTWGARYSSKELQNLLLAKYSSTPARTVRNGINSLIDMLKNTPIGTAMMLGKVELDGKERLINKIGTDEVHPIAIAYSIYKYGHNRNRFSLKVSEFYKDEPKDGPYHLFNISKEVLEKNLRWLQEYDDRLIRVDLKGGLDNIHLNETIVPEDIIMK